MITPRSFKPYHGCFGRFQGRLETPVDLHSGDWIEVVGKRGKEKKRSTRFARSVALGPSNNQAGTNLKSGRGTKSYVLIGGNQVRVPSSGIAYSCPGAKGTVTVENSGKRNPQRKQNLKLGTKKHKVKFQKWQQVQKGNKKTFAELEKWLSNSKKEIKKISAYLLERKMVVKSQLFQAHHKEVLKDRAATLKDTTMLTETLAAAWRIRHEILKMEVTRLPEKYQDLAWNLVRRIYFRALGNRQLLDPIFENLIKVAESNAVFWEKMKLVEEKAKDIEQSYDDLISAASSIAHLDYQFPLDLSVKKSKKRHERRQVQRLAKREKIIAAKTTQRRNVPFTAVGDIPGMNVQRSMNTILHLW